MEAPRPSYERRIVSVLFADLVGFTTLSERLDPEDVATVQDAYFASVREIIGRYGGLLEKFIGDAAMAVFGVPRARDDDAEHAVRAGLALVSAIEQLGGRLGLAENDLRVRVGINSGEVVAADAGPDRGRVTGDTVNTAARLQTAAEPGEVLIGETTRLMVADTMALGPVRPLELKGKAGQVNAAPVLAALPQRSRDAAMGRLRAPLIGRETELEALGGAIHRALAGESERWLILAPPGVGKTRLVDALAAHARERGLPVWRGRSRSEISDPFDVAVQLASAAVGEAAPGAHGGADLGAEHRAEVVARLERRGVSRARAHVLGVHIGELLAGLPVQSTGPAAAAGEPAGQAHGTPEPGSVERGERFAAWIEALDVLAGGPALWLIEDLHWAGPDLLALLDQAAATPAERGRLIVATARPSLLERRVAPGEAEADSAASGRGIEHRLDLEALPPAQTAALVRALVGDALPDALVSTLAERSGGNPLFVEELLRTWASIGTLEEAGDGWRLTRPAESIELPFTVQAIYASQLDDLPGPSRRLARRASVAGRRFLEEELGPLDAGDPAALEQLTLRAFLDGPEAHSLGSAYSYRHVLLRDAGYASLARAERALLHVRLARWLEAAAGSAPDVLAEEIAAHYASAVDELPALATRIDDALDRATLATITATWLDRAGVVLLRRSAHEAARELFRRALDLGGDAAPVLDTARRWQHLGDATVYSGDMDEGVVAYRRAEELFRRALGEGSAADRDAARSGFAESVAALGTARIEQLRFREAEALAEESLGVIGASDDLPSARLRYLRAWAQLAYQSNLDLRAELADVERIAAREGDEVLRVDALFQLSGLRDELGERDPNQMAAEDARLAELALATGNVSRAGSLLRFSAISASERDLTAAAAPLARARELAEAHGLTEDRVWAAYAATEVAFAGGEWQAAWDSGLEALELAERNAYLRPVVRTWFALSPMALAQRRVDALERAKAWFDPRRDEFPDSPFGRFMHTALDLRLAAADLMPAFVPDERLLDIWDEAPGMPSLYAAADTILDAWLAAGRADLATTSLERLKRWLDHPSATPMLRATYELQAARVALPDSAPAESHARTALAEFRGLGQPFGVARALRLLERLGLTGDAEISERRDVEARLGIG